MPPGARREDVMDPPVPVPAVGIMEDGCDALLESAMAVGVLQPCLVVDERGTGQAGRGEQVLKAVFCLESDYHGDPQPRCASLKALSFSRYAISARSRSFSRRNYWASSIWDSSRLGGRPGLEEVSASGP